MSSPSLLSVIFADIVRHKLVLVLLVMLLSSALALVFVTHQTRLQVAKQDEQMALRDKLNIEWRHLEIESDTLTEHYRVQYVAKHKLNMVLTNSGNEKVIKLP